MYAVAGTHAVAGVSSIVDFSAIFVQVLDFVDAVAGTHSVADVSAA